MTQRIKHVSELPKWFRLDKYNNAKKLDANGWYEQLCIRANALMYYEENQNEAYVKITQDASFKEALEDIRENPIFDMKGDKKLPLFFYFDSIEIRLKSRGSAYTPSIHSMTLEEFDELKKCLDTSRLDYASKWKAQFFKRVEGKPTPVYVYQPWIREPIYNSMRQEIKDGYDLNRMHSIIIDLNFPDKILIENFKQYLAARRTESSTEHLSKSNRQHDFSDWIHYGILPYLDLKTWEQETGTKIPYRVIADAIYPAGEGGEESVRKTTIPLAISLLKDDQLRHLIAQAAVELTECKDS